jgi:glutaredoxin-related protein
MRYKPQEQHRQFHSRECPKSRYAAIYLSKQKINFTYIKNQTYGTHIKTALWRISADSNSA